MKCRYILGACIIALSSCIYPSNGSDKPMIPVTEAVAIEVSVADKVAEIESETARAVEAPIIVPFDQRLYTQFCDTKSDYYWRSFSHNGFYLMLGSVALATCALQIYHTGGVLPVLNAFWASSLYQKLGSLWQTVGVGITSLSVFATSNVCATQWDRFILWADRGELEVNLKQRLWHREVYEQLGKPEIIGTIPVTGAYWLKCERVNPMMHETFDLDPFNAAHVQRIFLGFEDMRCSHITVQLPE